MRDIESKISVIGDNVVRSYLERKWALFFQRLKIDFEYEPERLDDGSNLGYLPDFLIHKELYLEIKPTIEIARKELKKPYGFVRETNKRLLIVIGDPPGERIIALIRLDNNNITYKDVSWMSWEHLERKSNLDIHRETAAANYALNEVDVSIHTPIQRYLSKIMPHKKTSRGS